MTKLAQVDYSGIEGATGLKFAGGTIGDIINSALPVVFVAAGLLLLVYFLFAGFQFLTSAGDPKKIQEAQSKIISALVGFIIIFASFWIIQILGGTLQLEDVKNIFGVPGGGGGGGKPVI